MYVHTQAVRQQRDNEENYNYVITSPEWENRGNHFSIQMWHKQHHVAFITGSLLHV